MQAEESAIPHTNEEYIQPTVSAKEPGVLRTVFHAVVVETIKDFFGSIFGFVFRYIRHFLRSFLFFWSPTLRKKPFDELDYKENCQHAFELALLVLFAIIFAVKLEWIPATSADNLNLFNNDLTQMSLQFVWFLIFAVCYFLLAMLSILFGRLFRSMLSIKISKRESDILSIYLNNAFFSITSVTALVVRCIVSIEVVDTDTIGYGLVIIFFLTCLVLILLWALRFAIVQKLGFFKGLIFFILATCIYTVIFTLGGTLTSIFFIVL